LKLQEISSQIRKSKVFVAKLGFAAVGMTFVGLYLFADYI
jgi:hypothetical protein|tara:strand:+ start:372 stop:491 length:120 start_codon:yes stop_codon:yes gene_type:complete